MSFLLYINNPFQEHRTNFVDFLKRITKTTQIRVFQIENDFLPFYFLIFESKNDLQTALNILAIIKRQFIANLEFCTENNLKVQGMYLSKGQSAILKEYEACVSESGVLEKFKAELNCSESRDPDVEMSEIYKRLLESWTEQEKEIKEEFFKKLKAFESKPKRTVEKH